MKGWPLGSDVSPLGWPRSHAVGRYANRYPWNVFELIQTNHTSGATTTPGTTVTPAQNAYGNWADMLTLTEDCYAIDVIFGTTSSNSASLTRIGVDESGGTNYRTLIPGLYTQGARFGRYQYSFPLFIPAGASLAAAGSVNNATVGTQQIWVRCHCRPTRRDLIRWGTQVHAYGLSESTSSGTNITGQEFTYSAWQRLDRRTDTRYFHWQVAFSQNGGANIIMALLQTSWGGYGGENMMGMYAMTGSNDSTRACQPFFGRTMETPGGVGLWVRETHDGASAVTPCVAMYGVC